MYDTFSMTIDDLHDRQRVTITSHSPTSYSTRDRLRHILYAWPSTSHSLRVTVYVTFSDRLRHTLSDRPLWRNENTTYGRGTAARAIAALSPGSTCEEERTLVSGLILCSGSKLAILDFTSGPVFSLCCISLSKIWVSSILLGSDSLCFRTGRVDDSLLSLVNVRLTSGMNSDDL